jgi:hypothetical protein
MKKIIFFAILFLLSTLSFAQENYIGETIEFGNITAPTPMYTAETIDELIGSSSAGITVYGSTNAESDYIEYTNATSLKFDQDSGFTVIPDEESNALKVSLGSAWTTLIPDIPSIYTNAETGEVITHAPMRPSGEEMIHISVVQTNETGTFWDYEHTNKNEKTFLFIFVD